MDSGLIQRAAKDILNSYKTVAFTGAGISVERIPAFRGTQGLWDKYDPVSMPISKHSIKIPERSG
jgi:NAD-dependent deacetylase